MKKYPSFNALATDNMEINQSGVSQMSAFNETAGDAQPVRDCRVRNFYGDKQRHPPTCDLFSEVMVSITSQEILDKLDEYDTRQRATWEMVEKSNPMVITTEVSTEVKDGGGVRKFNGSVNMQTGKLTVADNKGDTIGVNLPISPVNAIISAIDRNNPRLIEAAEKVVWDYVNNNPERFM